MDPVRSFGARDGGYLTPSVGVRHIGTSFVKLVEICRGDSGVSRLTKDQRRGENERKKGEDGGEIHFGLTKKL
jgi:hypothetical protein